MTPVGKWHLWTVDSACAWPLKQAASEGVDPSKRIQPLQRPGGGGSAALRACESTILGTFDTVSLVDDVIQDLFPAAQAIRESAPMSTCLRFSIEYARYLGFLLHAHRERTTTPRAATTATTEALSFAQCALRAFARFLQCELDAFNDLASPM
jgi:hypothetical protein